MIYLSSCYIQRQRALKAVCKMIELFWFNNCQLKSESSEISTRFAFFFIENPLSCMIFLM